jgi:hypothetical protein
MAAAHYNSAADYYCNNDAYNSASDHMAAAHYNSAADYYCNNDAYNSASDHMAAAHYNSAAASAYHRSVSNYDHMHHYSRL